MKYIKYQKRSEKRYSIVFILWKTLSNQIFNSFELNTNAYLYIYIHTYYTYIKNKWQNN